MEEGGWVATRFPGGLSAASGAPFPRPGLGRGGNGDLRESFFPVIAVGCARLRVWGPAPAAPDTHPFPASLVTLGIAGRMRSKK